MMIQIINTIGIKVEIYSGFFILYELLYIIINDYIIIIFYKKNDLMYYMIMTQNCIRGISSTLHISASGQLQCEENYIAGIQPAWYESGQLQYELNYKADRLHGYS